MEFILKFALLLFITCIAVFFVGLIQLISSKGKSKSALKMVIISIITSVVLFVIGFGTCLYSVSNH